jgi:hypothetical protein
MTRTRDDFSHSVKEVIKYRAALRCSKPNCNVQTAAGSSKLKDKVLYIGKVAHITAASEGGPRYDPNMTKEERTSVDNGILLCSNCADEIDKNNGADFPAETLRSWKSDHEKKIIEELNKNITKSKESTTINVTSNNQSGGITAGIVNFNKIPRILSDENKVVLKRNAETYKDYVIDVQYLSTSSEAYNAGQQIIDYFNSIGYQTRPLAPYIYVLPPAKGIKIAPQHKEKELWIFVGDN